MILLPQTEEQIMNVIWSHNPISATELTSLVNKRFHKAWKIQTVSTFMTRLAQKGFIEQIASMSRSRLYIPVIAVEDYRKAVLENMLDTLYNGETDAAVKDMEKIAKEK